MISKGGYMTGDRLPSERDLVAKLGVSRRSLRKAFELLEAEGEVWRGVGQGTFVGQRHLLTDADVLAVARLTSPEEVMQARLILEPSIAAMAARRASSDDLARVRHCLEKSRGVQVYEAYDLWDERFHTAVARAAQHRLLSTLYLTVNRLRAETSWGSLRRPVITGTRVERSIVEHEQILLALEDRDARKAEANMRKHLESVYRTLFEAEPETR